MNERDWQTAFGEVPEDFHRRLCATLDGLEEKEMKKRYKWSTMLIAALVAALLVTGAAVAATRLGILAHMVKYPDPIEPLPGAEAMVATDLGSAENELVKLTVLEAVYDGQGVMFEVKLQPKDPQDVLFHDMLQDYTAEDYIIEREPAPTPEGSETNEQDGVTYYTERVIGRKDGRRLVWYSTNFEIEGDETWGRMLSVEMDAEEQPDGSVIIWMSSDAEAQMPEREIQVKLGGKAWVDDGEVQPLEPITFRLSAGKDERRVKLEPVGDGRGERCQIVGGEILFTRIRGYMTVDYLYEPAESEDMGTVLDVLDADGRPIATGSGWEDFPETVDGVDHCRAHWQIQSFDEVPETPYLQVRVIGEDGPDKRLGRIACRIVEP